MRVIHHLSGLLAGVATGALLAWAPHAVAEAMAAPAAQGADQLSEVVVTAQKRSERLLSVAVPVTALQASDLEREGAVRLQDYAAKAPGLNLLSEREGETQIILRGVTTGIEVGATTAVYIDDSPFGSSTSYALGGQLTPDLDPGELQRVEVLRGPQGTLYGASSLGGLVKYVTTAPSLDRYGGRIEADASAVDGGGAGYGGRLMLNAPIVKDVLGLTISGFDRRDPGYIDNLVNGDKNINAANVDGGRAALLWKPTDRFSLTLSALFHDSFSHATSDEDLDANLRPVDGGLKQVRYTNESFNVRDRLFSANASYDLGWATVTSITSYQKESLFWAYDETQTYGPYLENALSLTDLGVVTDQYIRQSKTTEELRIASPNNARLEWQAGFFFTHEDSHRDEYIDPFDTASGQPLNLGFTLGYAGLFSRYTEYAGFGDVTYHFTPHFDLQAGLRYAANEQHYVQPADGLLLGGASVVKADSSDSSTTFLVAPRYKFNQNEMVYVRIASGYRPGGPNAVTLNLQQAGVPAVFKPDTLTNYEVGYKAAFPSADATLQLSAFDIEWNDIQVLELIQGISALGNGAGARSAGLEAAATWRPLAGLNLSANLAYTDAYLTSDAPGVGGHKGDELPEVPRTSVNLSGDYDFPITGALDGFVGMTVRYQGDRRSEFVSTAPANYVRPTMKAYETVDLRAGVSRGGLELEVFVKNLNNSHGLNRLSSLALDGYSTPLTASVIQPRTFGISLSDKF